MVEGHPSSECNGAYHKDQSPEALLAMNLGRPRFENVAGFHLYRHDLISATQVYTPCNTIDTRFEYPAQDTWIIRNKYTPNKPNCNACIVSKDGPLPLGTHTWKLSPTAVGKPKGNTSPPKSLFKLETREFQNLLWDRLGIRRREADAAAAGDGPRCSGDVAVGPGAVALLSHARAQLLLVCAKAWSLLAGCRRVD